jgi:hypothetical protein
MLKICSRHGRDLRKEVFDGIGVNGKWSPRRFVPLRGDLGCSRSEAIEAGDIGRALMLPEDWEWGDLPDACFSSFSPREHGACILPVVLVPEVVHRPARAL